MVELGRSHSHRVSVTLHILVQIMFSPVMPIKQIKLSLAKQQPVWKLMVIIKSWNLED